MSVRVLSEVWQKSKASGGALLVLLAIADNADATGAAFPSEKHVADKARLSVRQLRRVLSELTKAGELELWAYRYEGKGPERNAYRVLVGEFAAYRGELPEIDRAGGSVTPKIPAAVRAAVFERDGHACLRCASVIDLQIDHVAPRSAGGSDEPENLQTLCGTCNRWKRTQTIDFRGSGQNVTQSGGQNVLDVGDTGDRNIGDTHVRYARASELS